MMGLCSQDNTNNYKAAPCSRQNISFRETGMEASLQMVPCQQFLAHSTLQQGQESAAALKKATGTASTGLTVLPRPSQGADHEALSCGPPWVLKFIQGQDCPSDSYLKLVKVIHISIAQTQHWHLCSADYIIHQWHLPMVYSRLQASINSAESNIQRSTDSNKAVFVWMLEFQSRRLRRYSPTYQTRNYSRKYYWEQQGKERSLLARHRQLGRLASPGHSVAPLLFLF